MDEQTRLLVSDAPVTRLGQLVLAGQLIDDEPVMPAPPRVMDDYVLSVVFAGHGSYQHADGRRQPISAGAVTVVHPRQPHWYGTDLGERWTEVFAVFNGPLFDMLADAGLLANDGPRYPSPSPVMAALQAVVRARPSSRLSAERQLLALAGWLVDAAPPDAGRLLSPEIVNAVERLSGDLDSAVDLRSLAADVGLSYDVFRRRFVAEVGQPPRAFRNERRLNTAATLLRLTDLTIRAIARTLGYVDEFHLSRRFRARFGIPPRDYRRRD